MDSSASMRPDLLGRLNVCANFDKTALSMNVFDMIGYPTKLRRPALYRTTVQPKSNGRIEITDDGSVATWLVVWLRLSD